MKNIAIIPARGGSKRIPRKNIRHFNGKPIIAYSIAAARETRLFNHIVVSTEDHEIAEIARLHGAETPFQRPAALANDHTGVDAVVLHALKWFLEQGMHVKHVCGIFATAPFVRHQDILLGYKTMIDQRALSAFSVTTFPFPIFRALKIDKRGRLEMIWPENYHKRSQDLLETYHDAAQFYWADADAYLQEKTFLTTDAIPIVLPRYRVNDIDTPEDWQTTEKMYLCCNSDPD